jgi:SPOR domain
MGWRLSRRGRIITMADRYQERRFAADEYDRGADPRAPVRGEGDPLAELARLIGQSESSGIIGRANLQVARRATEFDQDQEQIGPDADLGPPSGPPSWLQRANRQEAAIPESEADDYEPSAMHPLQRYGAARSAPEPKYEESEYADAHEPDPSRYDDALYGQINDGLQHQQYQDEEPYADDRYDLEGHEDEAPADPVRKRGGIFTVMVVLALAVVGTGAAFAYRTYAGSSRSGEPPIIKADTSPTKVVPAPSDGSTKLPDRMVAGDAAEKIVPREEAPVDVARAGPRVVFPALSQNGAPAAANVAVSGPAAANGTLPNNEPRKIKTLTVRGDQPDGAALPVTSSAGAAGKQAAPRAIAAPPPGPATRSTAAAANASASGPLSLVPQATAPATETKTRLADITPTQPVAGAPASGGGYLVQVSSQRNEADAQASYRALQGKFPTVLGSHGPLIKRADLGDKGVYYRAMVGPFGTPEEASQFCGNLKTAGGQCVVQRN